MQIDNVFNTPEYVKKRFETMISVQHQEGANKLKWDLIELPSDRNLTKCS